MCGYVGKWVGNIGKCVVMLVSVWQCWKCVGNVVKCVAMLVSAW